MTVSTKQFVVVGVFEHRTDVAKTVTALLAAAFRDDQIGFAARENAPRAHIEQPTRENAHALLQGEGAETVETDATASQPSGVVRGLVGGLLGALDMLLVPITGPAYASTALETALPATEQMIERLPHRHAEEHAPARPDAAMTMPESTPTTEAETETERRYYEQEEQDTSIVAGGVVGGIAGAAAAFLIPGIGPVLAGGILVAAFGGGALGSVSGNFLGAFSSLGIPREQAHAYEQQVRSGHTVVTVKTPDRQQDAIEILRQHGAQDIQVHEIL